MANQQNAQTSASLAITGSGGKGAMTAGALILDAAAKAGWYGLQTRSVGPQIRGGEAAALLRIASFPVDMHDDAFGLLIALDWANFKSFAAELMLREDSVVIHDPASGDMPEQVSASNAQIVSFPLKEMAAAIPGGRVNMIALGIAAGALGISEDIIADLIKSRLSSKGEAAISASTACVAAGHARAEQQFGDTLHLAPARREKGKHWIITGNEAVGLGAVRGGVRFAAAYPITPATEILEWLSSALAEVGGTLVQAEDELASINMIIGASFGGVPSITATSGPGFALMSESIGLATAAEVPIVVVDVMRGGPSTGIPTKSEQSDLNIAVYGLHGDAPHVVVAPLSIRDCLFTTQWAVHLAEAMQVPAIVLSDQYLGQARAVIDQPDNLAFLAKRREAAGDGGVYQRYAVGGGVSPMAIPGTPRRQYTAEGLGHSASGTPSTRAEDHLEQLDKRRDKLEDFDYGQHWADISGAGEIGLITWGSCAGAVGEARRLAHDQGCHVKTIAMRLLAPARPKHMAKALAGVSRLIVVEQSHSGQFWRYLRAHYDLPANTAVIRRPGPLAITAREICAQILNEKTS